MGWAATGPAVVRPGACQPDGRAHLIKQRGAALWQRGAALCWNLVCLDPRRFAARTAMWGLGCGGREWVCECGGWEQNEHLVLLISG